jgi:hypothetical protein
MRGCRPPDSEWIIGNTETNQKLHLEETGQECQ